jgi:hypothetical protein
VWSGEEMIAWGGCGDDYCKTSFSDGAAYNPETDSWRMIAGSPLVGRIHHMTVWSGSEMLVLGGRQSNRTGAAYSPSSDSWRVIPDAPFRISYERPDSSWRRDVVSGVLVGDQLVVWSPETDEITSYSPATDEWAALPSTGLLVDLGVLRWTGEELYALGALTKAYPNRVPLQGVRMVGQQWAALPPIGMGSGAINIGAEPKLTAWVDDRLVAIAHTEGKALSYQPAADAWKEIDHLPLPGSEVVPEPMVIDDRMLVFHYGQAAIYDPETEAWAVAGVPYSEAGRAVWTGEEVLSWGEGCCGPTKDTPYKIEAWRYTPPGR